MRHSHTHSRCWVFIKQSDRPDHLDLGPHHAPRGTAPAHCRSTAPSPPRSAQEPEATLLPKFWVHFAEFPNLPSPTVPEVPNLGLLMRISVRWRQHPAGHVSRWPARPGMLSTRAAHSSSQHNTPTSLPRQQERKPCSRAAHPAASTSSRCSAAAGEFAPHSLSAAAPRRAIRTGSLAPHHGRREILALFGTRTLVRKSATYTEICTLRRSTRRLRPRFHAAQPPSYPSSPQDSHLAGEGAPPAHSSSALHFRNAPVRLVSCYTLLSGCRLLRPPPSCLHEPNPFLPRVFRRLRRPRGSIRLALPAYQAMPTNFPASSPSRFEAACRPRPTLAASLTYGHLRNKSRFPKRNFGGNQQLARSIGLSPLRASLTSDLRVSTATDLHRRFQRLHPAHA